MTKVLEGYKKLNLDEIQDCYYINADGKVYRDYGKRIAFLNPRPNSYGYLRVSLMHKDGRRVDRMLHVMIMKTFIPNPDNKPFVNHIDGNKQNNSLDNLEWSSAKENLKHSREVLGNVKPSSKAVDLYYMGEFVKSFDNILDACDYAVEEYKSSRTGLQKYWTCNGCALIKRKCND